MTKQRFRWATLAVALCAVAAYFIAASVGGSAVGPGGSDAVSVPGAAFTPDHDGCTYTRDNYSGEYESIGGCRAEAGIYLPSGAKVTEVLLYGEKGTGGATVHLEANDVFGDHVDLANPFLQSNNCSADPCFVSATSIVDPIVDNTSSHYGIWLNPQAGFVLYKVVVKFLRGPYTLPHGVEAPSHHGN